MMICDEMFLNPGAHHAISEVFAAHLDEFDGGQTLVFRQR